MRLHAIDLLQDQMNTDNAMGYSVIPFLRMELNVLITGRITKQNEAQDQAISLSNINQPCSDKGFSVFGRMR